MKTAAPCKNCGRTKKLSGRDLCGSCYSTVREYGWGTPECIAALAEAKKKFGDPNYKRGEWGKVKTTSKPAPAKTRHNISEAAIIDQLKEQREDHLTAAKKLEQAIELLSS